MRLHTYVFLCLLISMALLIYLKPMYSEAGYNPLTNEVKVHNPEYQEKGLPEHIRVHEDVHRRQWLAVILMLLTALATVWGFAINHRATEYTYMSYILLSVLVEATAYLLTPISLHMRTLYIGVISTIGIGNIAFWHYFFRRADLQRPVRWRDLPIPPIAAVLFWLV